ncbi:MAG: hypothetical protein KatS3mg021_1893 [Fimbriimonadales bacterium]|nr:MAG: hypothetical protein KatS3mg021_1893 [Fimbriimonadales bacterium]
MSKIGLILALAALIGAGAAAILVGASIFFQRFCGGGQKFW